MKSQPTFRRVFLHFIAAAFVVLGGASAFSSYASSGGLVGRIGQDFIQRSLFSSASPSVAPSGRYIRSRADLLPQPATRTGALGRRSPLISSTTNPNNVNDQGVQTFDVAAPPSNNFQPIFGYLYPTNRTPVWSRDETYIVFASNRAYIDNTGAVATDGRYHLWYVAASGGVPLQITTGPSGVAGTTGEAFPVLNVVNNAIAFTSDINTPGVQNLYTIPFTPGQALIDVSTLTSLTIRQTGNMNVDLVTGFGSVGRPAWSPGGDKIAFAAVSGSTRFDGSADPNAGHSHIYYLFTDSNGYRDAGGESTDNPPAELTNGPADDTDPAWSQDSRYIAFASTAATLANTGTAIDPLHAPTLTTVAGGNINRSIFLLSGGLPQPDAFGVAVNTAPSGGPVVLGRITLAGTDNFGPAWSNLRFNQYTNPSGDNRLEYLAFARGASPAAPHDIDYLLTAQAGPVGAATLSEEGSTVTIPPGQGGASSINNAILLNTDDNAGQTTPAGNAYNDIYPTFAPFQSVFRIAYQSNRSVTYTDPATANGTPVETAISLPESASGPTVGSAGTAGTVGLNYTGILESQVLNLDPPTLLRYSGNEVIHVTDTLSGRVTKTVQPGQSITFTVRLTNREAGIDDTGYTNGGPKVFLQIKDPDSKYQDSQGLEHKVFTTDAAHYATLTAQNLDSGSATTELYNLHAGEPVTIINNASFNQRGAVGGNDGSLFITVGHYTGAGLLAAPPNGPTHPYSTDPNFGYNTTTIDPNFTPWGQEYECQYVNPQFAASGTGDTSLTDYGTPYYLAGIDDQTPFSGSTDVPRPTANDTVNNLPAEWLQMQRAATQDDQGGVLYTVTWATPKSASDYYLDVIAYDKAQFPALPQGASPNFQGQAYNWRIYDNTGGFSTATFNGGKDILVVSDNALGQKFGFSVFGGLNGQQNLKPTLYGAESYYTDVDVNILPNAAYIVDLRKDPVSNQNVVSVDVQGFGVGILGFPVENGLGFDSYSNDLNQQYSLWRILSRGPVPESVLRAYEPSAESQPAVDDPVSGFHADPADGGTGAGHAAQVLNANRCVIWVSPFTGDLFTDAGSLSDSTTQDELRAFTVGPAVGQTSTLTGKGRLFVSGQDVASTLTLQGNANNAAGSFLTDVLNATYQSDSGGTVSLAASAAAGNRISYDGFFNPAPGLGFGQNFFEITSSGSTTYFAPGQTPVLALTNNFGLAGVTAADPHWRTDASADEFGPYGEGFGSNSFALGSIDTILAQNSAHTDIKFNALGFGAGGTGLIYNEMANGSRTIYASFGLEGLGIEYYTVVINNQKYYAPRNNRPNVLHNVVTYLRTGRFTGTIRQGTSGGVGVPNATVYLLANGGVAIPGSPANRQTFSALTDINGNYVINGVEPGAYIVYAYKQGFTRASTLTTNTANAVGGDETSVVNLNISPLPPGTLSGKVTDNANPANPVDGATVTFTSADGSTTLSAVTANGGLYTITNVPTGTYTGVASKLPQYSASPTQSVTVTGGQVTTANFVIALAGASVAGRVYDVTTGNDIPGATVTVTPGTVAAVTTGAQIDTSPNYAFASVPASATGTQFTITATKAGYVSAAITLTVKAGDALTGQNIPLTPVPPVQNGTLGGLVADAFNGGPLGGATVTVTDATGKVVATVKTSATTTSPAAPTGDGAPLNYSVSLAPGTYTVSVSASGFTAPAAKTATVASVAFTRLDFTGSSALQSLHVFTAGYNFFSVPYNYAAAGVTFDTLFGTLNTGTTASPSAGSNRSHVAVWQPLLVQYVLDPTPPADTFHLGQGYWVYLLAKREVTIGPPTAPAPTVATISVGLHPVWNMIGVPSATPISVSRLTFANPTGGGAITFDQASTTYHLVSPILYTYNGSSYVTLSTGDTLQPWQAYWIQAYVDTTVLIPTGGG